MFKKMIAATVLALVASSSFAATPQTFYAGADVGSTKVDAFNGSDTSFGVFGGYNFTPNFAAELGARRLGSWGDVDLTQVSVSVVGTLPLQQGFELFGRLGYNHIDADDGFDDSSDGAVVGIGLGYRFTPKITGRIEYQKPASDVGNFSAGVVFNF